MLDGPNGPLNFRWLNSVLLLATHTHATVQLSESHIVNGDKHWAVSEVISQK